MIQSWNDLFKNSSFVFINKEEFNDLEVQKIISKFNYPQIEKYHPDRKKEFLLGRYCAYKAIKNLTQKEFLDIPIDLDRSPVWPIDLVGSITHNHQMVGCAVGFRKEYAGIGIDFEELGRTKIELRKHITIEKDLMSHPNFSDEELLTIIFSAKESLYKTLYPTVKKFFGFDYAFVSEINVDKKMFKIHLDKSLEPHFYPQEFIGRFHVINGVCLTLIELDAS